MHTGHVISGTGHAALILWLLIGGWLRPTPDPVEFTDVSVISGAAFDAMVASREPPQSATEVAQPSQPEVQVDAPEVSSDADRPVEQPAPVQTETPPEDAVPEVTQQELPPETQVEDTPPDLSEPVGDVAVLVPEVSPEAAPRPVERVAPEPVAQPDPEVTPDPVEQQAVVPDAEGTPVEEPQQEARAPEEATTEVVTEATQAPTASPRPPGRRPAAPPRQVAEAPVPDTPARTPPAAPAADPAPTETPADPPSEPVSNDDVLAALAAAAESEAAPAQPAAPTGPPLSASEREALRVAVSRCWSVGPLSTEAMGTIVTVGVQMNQNGTPVIDTIRLISASGGSNAAAQKVFESARRAIILCGKSGFNLPPEKFGQWQTIEMTFDPRKMGF